MRKNADVIKEGSKKTADEYKKNYKLWCKLRIVFIIPFVVFTLIFLICLFNNDDKVGVILLFIDMPFRTMAVEKFSNKRYIDGFSKL